jgi:tetratricopeptide (TPR) repeat protein
MKYFNITLISFNLLVFISCSNKPREHPDYSKANIAYDSGDYKTAIDEYTKVIEKFPEEFLPYYFRGSARFNSSDYEGAMADYTKVLELRDDNFLAYDGRGWCSFELKKYAKAKDDFRKSFEIKPLYAESISNLGYVFFMEGQIDSALFYYNLAVERDPKCLMALFNRAQTYDSLKKYSAAIDDYSSILAIDSANYQIYSLRGKMKEKAEDRAGAKDDYKLAAEFEMQHNDKLKK